MLLGVVVTSAMTKSRIKMLLIAAVLTLTFIGPLWTLVTGKINLDADWRTANRESAHIAPNPKTTPEAVIQVYSARAFSWRGLFAVHTWIAVKAKNAPQFTTYQVIGWRTYRGMPPLEIAVDIPDRYWYGQKPEIIYDLRGETAEKLIPKLDAAARSYPDSNRYTVWPGPNSNTFPAYIARQVPELMLTLPANALGQDWLPNGAVFSRTPSGTGYQFSLFGVLGITLAKHEGFSINLLGLPYGISPYQRAIILPGVGFVRVI